jgi:hypothetical protein
MMALRVAILGNPSQPDVSWDAEQISQLTAAGFNAVQLNIAWSYRPNDEALNLEDLIEVEGSPRSLAADGDRGRGRRAEELRRRAALASAAGMRTMLHVGLPFQGRAGFDGAPLPQCISDPATLARYARALGTLASEHPHLDDLLVYSYDQDAWVCSEFNGCDRCAGIPVHSRLPAFLRALATVWYRERLDGRFWWEPWELSAGQALAAIPEVDPLTMGLMLHSSIAEVISTMPGDAFFRNAAAVAKRHGVPLVAEVFLSSANEEVEPWRRLPVPLVTLRQLRVLEEIAGVAGFKEYFGLVPSPYDVNLRAAAAYFSDPAVSDSDVLAKCAAVFGRDWLPDFWTRTSAAYGLYPWDATWFARQLGHSEPLHEMSSAIVRGSQSDASAWDTPAWKSSRASVFMRTTNVEPNPWLLEDVQLRFGAAARAMQDALTVFEAHFTDEGDEASSELKIQQSEAAGFVTRSLAYECHLRETNLATLLRSGVGDRDRLVEELRGVLVADLANQRNELARRESASGLAVVYRTPSQLQVAERWVVDERTDASEIQDAIAELDRDVERFLARFLTPGPDAAAAGQFSLTSR